MTFSRVRTLAALTLISTCLLGFANPTPLRASEATIAESQPEAAGLPSRVRSQVLVHIIVTTAQTPRNLRIVSASAETWSDSCLGLGGPAESCAQMLVPGWRVTVTNGDRTWVYRTNADASVFRQENPPADNDASALPRLTTRRLLGEISQRYDVPLADLSVFAAAPRTWDGCYGIPSPEGLACNAIAIFGWQVIVTSADSVWVYHTDQAGTTLYLNPVASQLGTARVVPEFIPPSEYPAADEALPGALVTTTLSGGITGSTYKVVLFEDGAIVRYGGVGSSDTAPVNLGRLSQAELGTFTRTLLENRVTAFGGLRYPAPEGAADYRSVSLAFAGHAPIQYADIDTDALPENLQAIIQAIAGLTQ